MTCKPPYSINTRILGLIAGIYSKLGLYEGLHLEKPSPQLRRSNRIKTLQASLAIEGNSLSEKQISDILDGRRIIGPNKDIIEVKNAIEAYDQIPKYKFDSEKSLLKTHQILMADLGVSAGKYRCGNVGIFKGRKVTHIAPPSKMLSKLMNSLFDFLSSDENALIKSCVFHYEFEFIHPFEDGNGRLGRLWQTVILTQAHSIFEYLPIESLIKANQKAYYKILGDCDKAGDSTEFIEFMLDLISKSLNDFLKSSGQANSSYKTRIEYAKSQFKKSSFKRKDYLELFKEISTATASRDLVEATKEGLLSKKGEKNQSIYRFVG